MLWGVVIDCYGSLTRSFASIQWPSRCIWTQKRDILIVWSLYGKSKILMCLGVEKHHHFLHLPLQPPSASQPYTSSVAFIFWPVCVLVCVCVNGSNGSGTSEDLFWKLDALQTFIRDLHWPEEEFAKHLESRIKLMSSNMIENCVKRYVAVHGSGPSVKSTAYSPLTSVCNVSLAFQHQDGLWVQADEKQ